jgi:hypothetical protein
VTSSVDLSRESDPVREPDPEGRKLASPRNFAMRSVSSDAAPPVQGDALASAGSSASAKESLDRRYFFAPPDGGPQTPESAGQHAGQQHAGPQHAGDEQPNAHVRVPSAK